MERTRFQMRPLVVFVCASVFVDAAIAVCTSSKYENGKRLKCFNATLNDAVFAHDEPSVGELMIFRSRIESIADRSFLKYGKSLVSLNMHDCRIREISDHAFDGLARLTSLSLAYNNLTSLRSRWFDSLTSLRQLDLSHNFIASIEAAVFEKLQRLQRLQVAGNRLTCLEPAQLVPMPGLEKLYFSGNPLTFRCRATLTLWLRDMGIEYKIEQRGEEDWLDSILWLCAADDGKIADSEVFMRECVALNLFNQLRTGLTTAESFPLTVPPECAHARDELTKCVAADRRHARELVTNGHVVRKLLRLLMETKSTA